MIIPVKCFTCGNVLANKYRYYLQVVSAHRQDDRIKYYTGKEFTEKSIEGKTLDELGLRKPCCRRHMLTHVDIE